MPDDSPYTVQRFRDGFAIVFKGPTGERKRYRLDAKDRPGAEAEARKRWDEGDQRPWTVGRIVEAYLSAKREGGIVTIDRRCDAWKAMSSYWAAVDYSLIDERMCRAYAASRQVSSATVRYELSMLSTALGFAKAKKWIADTPKVWLPVASPRRTRHLTPKQFKRLLANVVAPHARLYMLLGVFTLSRPTALFDLKWDRVDFQRGIIDLNPPHRLQTAKRRPVVPMNGLLRKELQTAYAARTSDFVIERGGRRIGSIRKAFAAASERSGVHATPYTLRHTGAVWAAEQGTSMSELAQMMGHDDDRTTQKHYARYSPEYLRNVATAVEDAFMQDDEGSD